MDVRSAYTTVDAAASRLDGYALVALDDDESGLVVYFTGGPSQAQRAVVENAAPGIPIEYRRAAVSKAVAAQLREAIETLTPELDQVGCVIIAHGRRSFSGHYRIVYSSDRPNPPAMLTAVTDDIAPGLVDFYPGRLDGNVIYVDRAANSGPA